MLQGAAEQWAPHAGTSTCVSQTDDSEGWETNGIAVESLNIGADGAAEVTCGTYHLSPFAVAEQEASSSEWVTIGQLVGAGVLKQVRLRPSYWQYRTKDVDTGAFPHEFGPYQHCRRLEALSSTSLTGELLYILFALKTLSYPLHPGSCSMEQKAGRLSSS